MSRSKKKTPATSTGTYNGSKRRANKRVRHLLKNPDMSFDHKSFKKVYCSWDIKDYKEVAPSFEVFSEIWLERWRRNTARLSKNKWKDNPPTRKQLWEMYQRWYLRK